MLFHLIKCTLNYGLVFSFHKFEWIESHHIEHKRQSLKKFSLFLFSIFECALFHKFFVTKYILEIENLGYDIERNSFLHMDDKSVESEKATVHFFSLSKPSHFTKTNSLEN